MTCLCAHALICNYTVEEKLLLTISRPEGWGFNFNIAVFSIRNQWSCITGCCTTVQSRKPSEWIFLWSEFPLPFRLIEYLNSSLNIWSQLKSTELGGRTSNAKGNSDIIKAEEAEDVWGVHLKRSRRDYIENSRYARAFSSWRFDSHSYATSSHSIGTETWHTHILTPPDSFQKQVPYHQAVLTTMKSTWTHDSSSKHV